MAQTTQASRWKPESPFLQVSPAAADGETNIDPEQRSGTSEIRIIPPKPLGALARLILAFTRFYVRSPLHRWRHRNGCPCIYLPTCREYLERAVLKYGAARGLVLAWKRLRRCNNRYHGFYLDFP